MERPDAPPRLFVPDAVEVANLANSFQQKLAAIASRPSTAHVDLRIFSECVTPALHELTLNLGGNRNVLALRTEVVGPDEPAKRFTWLGALVTGSANTINLVVNDGMCTGTLSYGEQQFEIRPLGRDAHVLLELDLTKLPGEHPPEFPSGAQKDGSP